MVKNIFTIGPSVKRRKVSKTEEVNFDPDARHEFLTGFRKRKQERIKHAQNAAEKRYREERRRDRAKVCLNFSQSIPDMGGD